MIKTTPLTRGNKVGFHLLNPIATMGENLSVGLVPPSFGLLFIKVFFAPAEPGSILAFPLRGENHFVRNSMG